MIDLLPDANIVIAIPEIEFLDQIAAVATELGTLQPEKCYASDGLILMDILNLRPIAEAPNDGFVGQLIHDTKDSGRIRVEIRALRWSGVEYPTYEIYVEAMQSIFRGLLTAYNKQYGTRYRLTIKDKASCEPKLSLKAQKALDIFVGLANKGGLHPLD